MKQFNIKSGLNPSFSGIWPVALTKKTLWYPSLQVLILLLVEYGLWQGMGYDYDHERSLS